MNSLSFYPAGTAVRAAERMGQPQLRAVKRLAAGNVACWRCAQSLLTTQPGLFLDVFTTRRPL